MLYFSHDPPHFLWTIYLTIIKRYNIYLNESEFKGGNRSLSTYLQRLKRRGVILTMQKLLGLGIDCIMTPDNWIFDIITEIGLKIAVKYKDQPTNAELNTWEFKIPPEEREQCDFMILILNTQEGDQFYVIPTREITDEVIVLNPSTEPDGHRDIGDGWDLTSDSPEN